MREERQKEAVQAFLDHSDKRSIINACPRFGKIKVAIDIINTIKPKNTLILTPRTDIQQGWLDDFGKFGRTGNIEFQTFMSIKKIKDTFDFLIIDEPHELSINQQNALKPWVKKYMTLGLTGTMTQRTRTELYENLNLDVCYKYTIDEGVKEGILADYRISVHKVALESKTLFYQTSNGKKYTEKDYFDLYQYIRKTAKQKHFIDMKLINIIQNSSAKRLKTVELLDKFSEDRVLVFCGTTFIADNLGIPVYHSKVKERALFNDFCKGKGDKLATIKMMQAGITVSPIHRGIINYMSGNPEDSAQKICRFLGLEYDNPDKIADIHIVTTDELFEEIRLKTGLLFFDQTKIKYI